MTILALTPYLILPRRAAQAIALYERAFDAKVGTIQRFGDVDQSCPAADRDNIMHAELKIGGALLMLSDGPGEQASASPGPVSVAVNLDDEAQAQRAFDTLAAGGTTLEPLKQAPWGALFGALIDPFGVSWMFNVTLG